MTTNKNSIYDRIPQIDTADLNELLIIWNRLLADRERTPRHDYIGKCALRATLVIEQRGGDIQPLPHSKVIRKGNP